MDQWGKLCDVAKRVEADVIKLDHDDCGHVWLFFNENDETLELFWDNNDWQTLDTLGEI